MRSSSESWLNFSSNDYLNLARHPDVVAAARQALETYGAGSTVDILVSGDDVPASLKRIVLEITVAGQRHELEFPPEPNQTHTLEWDGVDGFSTVGLSASRR